MIKVSVFCLHLPNLYVWMDSGFNLFNWALDYTDPVEESRTKATNTMEWISRFWTLLNCEFSVKSIHWNQGIALQVDWHAVGAASCGSLEGLTRLDGWGVPSSFTRRFPSSLCLLHLRNVCVYICIYIYIYIHVYRCAHVLWTVIKRQKLMADMTGMLVVASSIALLGACCLHLSLLSSSVADPKMQVISSLRPFNQVLQIPKNLTMYY